MKSFALIAVIALALLVHDVLSVCPSSGCDCGEFCVDSNNRWCNSTNDQECSCKEGCLVYDRMLTRGQKDIIYCMNCICPDDSTDGEADYHPGRWCIPDDLTLSVDYPNPDKTNPNCQNDDDDDDDEDDDYEDDDYYNKTTTETKRQ